MRRSGMWLHGGAWLLLAAAGHAQTDYWVSPTVGNDLNPGTAAQPLLTIGQALSMPASGSLTIWLMPGDYSLATNGETFPLVVTYADVTFSGAATSGAPQRCGAKLIHEPFVSPNSVFSVQQQPPPGIHPVAHFQDFAIETIHRAIQYTAVATEGSLTVRNLEVECWRGVAVNTSEFSDTTVVIDECDFSAVEECFRVSAVDSNVNASTARSTFTSFQPYPVMRLSSDGIEGTSVVGLTQTHSILRKGGYGIRAEAENGSYVVTVNLGCNFHDLGFVKIPGGAAGGGIVNSIANGTISHTVVNSIFNGNDGARDLPDFNGNDLIDHLMVEQTSLVGINGTFAGTPSWVAPDAGDYHLMPGSAAINGGNTAAAVMPGDFDGDPRIEPITLGLPVLVDVGPDEFYPRYLYVFPRRPKIGTTSAVRMFGPANSAFGWMFGFEDANGDVVDGTFGPSLHLMNPVFTFETGVVGANGFVEDSLVLPNSLGLVGLEIGEQALFSINPPTALWGWNGWPHMISR